MSLSKTFTAESITVLEEMILAVARAVEARRKGEPATKPKVPLADVTRALTAMDRSELDFLCDAPQPVEPKTIVTHLGIGERALGSHHAHFNARLKQHGWHFDDVIIRTWLPAQGCYVYSLRDEARDTMRSMRNVLTPAAA
jgi:hypothetical protein